MEHDFLSHPFFEGFDRDLLLEIVPCITQKAYAKGEYLARAGEKGSKFILLFTGKVRIELNAAHHGAIAIQTLEGGDVIGWSWLDPSDVWRFDAFAEEPTEAVILTAQCLRERCVANHEFGYQLLHRLMRVMTQRLEATRMQLLDIYGSSS